MPRRQPPKRSTSSQNRIRWLIAAAAFAFTALLFAIVYFSTRDGGEPSHAVHPAPILRIVFGPLVQTTSDTNIQLEASINLDAADPRAQQLAPAGMPLGDKVLLTLRITDSNNKPITGLNPKMNIVPVTGTRSTAQDPFEFQETFMLASSTGDMGIIEEGEHASHVPGRSLGRAAGTSYSAFVTLPAPTGEAVVDLENRYIFVTLPQNNAVAMVDALSRRIVDQIPVGQKPYHIALEPSGKRIWVGNDGDGTVTVIDNATHRATTLRVGAGHHEFAFAPESGLVFVSNHQSNTVSVINADQARVIAEVKVGISPHGMDYRAQRLYVANEGAGSISVLGVEGERVSTVATINAGAGARQVRIDTTGQIGVASNSRANTLTLFNTKTNSVIQTIKTGGAPDQIVFLGNYAVVRNGLTPNATFVHLDKPDIADEVVLGETAPLSNLAPTEHARLFVSSAGDEVSVPSPGDGQVYHLHVMDGRPMAMSQTKVEEGTDMIFSLVNHVHEISPGVYQRIVQFDREGAYALNLDLGTNKSSAQFSFNVVSTAPSSPWSIQPLQPTQPYVAGSGSVVQYRILNTQIPSAEPIRDGVITLYRFVPGQAAWQQILPAEYAGDNIYQARVVFPEAGAYAMTFNSPKSGLYAAASPRTTVQVVSR